MFDFCFIRRPKGNDRVPLPDFKELNKTSAFTVSELKRLFTRFCSLSNDFGLVESVEFLRQPELTFTPIASLMLLDEVQRVENLESNSSLGIGELDATVCEDDVFVEIDFVSFVRVLSLLSPRTPLEVKYRC